MTAQLVALALALLASGAMVGLMAGLFGVGGGTVVVPVLYAVFLWLGVPEEVRMPLCAGTSLALDAGANDRVLREEPTVKGDVDRGRAHRNGLG